MDLILVFHVVAFCLSDAYFCPLRSDTEYKKLFVRNFPIISIMSVLNFVFFLAYLLLSEMVISTNYIDSFYNKKICFFLIFYAIIILAITLFLVFKEIYNASEEAKSSKILLIPAIFIFLYTSSIIWGGIIINFTNNVLDFSRGEMQLRKIHRGQIFTSSTRGFKTYDYYLNVNPDVEGLYRFKVSKSIFDKARILAKGEEITNNNSSGTTIDMNEDVKLKVYVYKGLYGIRYVGKSMDVIK